MLAPVPAVAWVEPFGCALGVLTGAVAGVGAVSAVVTDDRRLEATLELCGRERRGRTVRAVVISAVLVERGGTWRQQVVFREALADPVRMRLALGPRLAQMPAHSG